MADDNPEFSFEYIHETLSISKSAVSNTINVLLTTNKIDYITKHGDRKRYFRNRLEKWESDFGINIEASLFISGLLKKYWPPVQKPQRRLIKIIDIISYLKSEMMGCIYERLNKEGISIPFPQRDLHIKSIDENLLEKIKTE